MVGMLQIVAGAGLWVASGAQAALSPLIVRRQPGLERVVVWYPSGEARTLAYEPEEDAFLGLPPPRFVARPAGRIEIFKHMSDGSVLAVHAWALTDGAELLGFVLGDPGERLMLVELDAWGDAVAELRVEGAGGAPTPLFRVRNSWHLDADGLDDQFDLTLVWRDGEQRRWPMTWRGAQLALRLPPAGHAPPPLAPVTALELGGRRLLFDEAGLALASAEVTAWLELGPGRLLVGTAGGDLVELGLDGERVVSGRYRDDGRWHQPVSGLARRADGVVMVGVLGDGVWQLEGGRLRRSALHLGTPMITALAIEGDRLWIGTATAGLWSLRAGRLTRSAYPVGHVSAIRAGAALVVEGGAGRYAPADDGWRRLDRGVTVGVSAPEWTGSAELDGVLLLGSREHGLFARRGASLEPVDLDLTPSERQIRALAVFDDEVWLATRAGLLVVSRDSCGVTVSRRHQAQAFAVGAGAGGVWVVSAAGRFQIGADGALRWLERRAMTPALGLGGGVVGEPLTAATGT